MAPLEQRSSPLPPTFGRSDLRPSNSGPANLADILERVLDKGIVIAGDIEIRLLEIELLTIKLRLLVCSVDRAQEMGINWWESDPKLSKQAEELEGDNRELQERVDRLERLLESRSRGGERTAQQLEEENRQLQDRVKRLEQPRASARKGTQAQSRGGNAGRK